MITRSVNLKIIITYYCIQSNWVQLVYLSCISRVSLVMSFCIKCNNTYEYKPKGNDLFKECRVCEFIEKAKLEDYKILSENLVGEKENLDMILGNIITDPTYPTITKNGKVYTVYVQPKTLKRFYVSHTDKKAYENIE